VRILSRPTSASAIDCIVASSELTVDTSTVFLFCIAAIHALMNMFTSRGTSLPTPPPSRVSRILARMSFRPAFFSLYRRVTKKRVGKVSDQRNLGGSFAGWRATPGGRKVDLKSSEGDEDETESCRWTRRIVGSEPMLASAGEGIPEGKSREGMNRTRWYRSS
jgi:hypothetical protein